jgi:hypothetical protein
MDEVPSSKVTEPLVDAQFIRRPREVLNQLPVAMKWEFTRRHPYYQEWWEVAADYLRAPSPDGVARARGHAAVLLLRQINIVDEPHPPGTSFADLGGNDLGRIWAGGAVAPAIFKTLVTILLLGLPPEACLAVGSLLMSYGTETEGSPQARRDAAIEILFKLADRLPVLNAYPDVPIVSINTDAPGRAIEEAVREIVTRFKEQRGVPETRRRADRLEDYLAVWDLREGWVDDHYDCARERTLADIAAELKQPVRTVQNRYARAFYFLVGHEYTPELWDLVVGRYKWSLVSGGAPLPVVFTRRPRQTKVPRPVPETTLSGPGEGEARFTADRSTEGGADYGTFLAEIREMIAEGRTNAEIRAKHELTDDRFEVALNYVRARPSDFAGAQTD